MMSLIGCRKEIIKFAYPVGIFDRPTYKKVSEFKSSWIADSEEAQKGAANFFLSTGEILEIQDAEIWYLRRFIRGGVEEKSWEDVLKEYKEYKKNNADNSKKSTYTNTQKIILNSTDTPL